VTQAAGLVVDETWTSPDPSEAGYCVWFTDQERDLVCYSKWDGAWLEEGRVNVPSVLAQPEKRILSPEPFEHNGESFIAFQFASGYGSPEGDIYVTTPRASVPCHFRRVSPVTVAPRRKPEPYLLAGRPVVYYLDTAGVDSIWMAETGL